MHSFDERFLTKYRSQLLYLPKEVRITKFPWSIAYCSCEVGRALFAATTRAVLAEVERINNKLDCRISWHCFPKYDLEAKYFRCLLISCTSEEAARFLHGRLLNYRDNRPFDVFPFQPRFIKHETALLAMVLHL